MLVVSRAPLAAAALAVVLASCGGDAGGGGELGLASEASIAVRSELDGSYVVVDKAPVHFDPFCSPRVSGEDIIDAGGRFWFFVPADDTRIDSLGRLPTLDGEGAWVPSLGGGIAILFDGDALGLLSPSRQSLRWEPAVWLGPDSGMDETSSPTSHAVRSLVGDPGGQRAWWIDERARLRTFDGTTRSTLATLEEGEVIVSADATQLVLARVEGTMLSLTRRSRDAGTLLGEARTFALPLEDLDLRAFHANGAPLRHRVHLQSRGGDFVLRVDGDTIEMELFVPAVRVDTSLGRLEATFTLEDHSVVVSGDDATLSLLAGGESLGVSHCTDGRDVLDECNNERDCTTTRAVGATDPRHAFEVRYRAEWREDVSVSHHAIAPTPWSVADDTVLVRLVNAVRLREDITPESTPALTFFTEEPGSGIEREVVRGEHGIVPGFFALPRHGGTTHGAVVIARLVHDDGTSEELTRVVVEGLESYEAVSVVVFQSPYEPPGTLAIPHRRDDPWNPEVIVQSAANLSSSGLSLFLDEAFLYPGQMITSEFCFAPNLPMSGQPLLQRSNAGGVPEWWRHRLVASSTPNEEDGACEGEVVFEREWTTGRLAPLVVVDATAPEGSIDVWTDDTAY